MIAKIGPILAVRVNEALRKQLSIFLQFSAPHFEPAGLSNSSAAKSSAIIEVTKLI
jgi:hypothetical protein